MFRLTRLKPPHGWNAVVWELAIVTLGVLIALVAQQFVDNIHQGGEVRELVAALRAEQADARARWEHVRASDPCTVQRLDALEQWNATAPQGAKLIDAYRLFLWNQHSGAWDLARTSDTTANIPLRQRLTFASLYDAINNWRQMINEENANTQALNGLLATADQPENRRQIAYRISLARICEPAQAQLRLYVQAVGRVGDRARRQPADGTAQRQIVVRTVGSRKQLGGPS